MGFVEAGRIFVVNGSDGAGKSTLFGSLSSMGYSIAHWRDVSKIIVDDDVLLMNDLSSRRLSHLHPYSRAWAIGNMLVNFYEYCIVPMISVGRDVIVDSYYFRIISKEEILNPQGAILLGALPSVFQKPYVVSFLECPLETSYNRNLPGHHNDYARPADRSFESYREMQVQCMEKSRRMISSTTIMHEISSSDSPDLVLENYLELLSSERFDK